MVKRWQGQVVKWSPEVTSQLKNLNPEAESYSPKTYTVGALIIRRELGGGYYTIIIIMTPPQKKVCIYIYIGTYLGPYIT